MAGGTAGLCMGSSNSPLAWQTTSYTSRSQETCACGSPVWPAHMRGERILHFVTKVIWESDWLWFFRRKPLDKTQLLSCRTGESSMSHQRILSFGKDLASSCLAVLFLDLEQGHLFVDLLVLLFSFPQTWKLRSCHCVTYFSLLEANEIGAAQSKLQLQLLA